MTIFEQIQAITEELISQNYVGYEISSQELKAKINARFGTNLGSIIPSDFCYNRVNKGIVFFKHPRLFAYVSRGVYQCFGKDYLYDGPVFAHPKESTTEVIVGSYKKGKFTQNHNWERYCLK